MGEPGRRARRRPAGMLDRDADGGGTAVTLDLMLRSPAPAVTPEGAGWRWVSYSGHRVSGRLDLETGGDEVCLVNLGGRMSVEAGGERFDLGERETPFDALPEAAYLPPETDFTVEGEGIVARCGSRA